MSTSVPAAGFYNVINYLVFMSPSAKSSSVILANVIATVIDMDDLG